ncbi:MAG: DNA adenine methylase [Flavobacteriaceae bacterium]|jgi:DNA adenine methylase|nr:DNA adenine methylase [Flavobacteriaceae bacterium]
MDANLRTPISYYGGKQSMLKSILPLMPEHRIYCEPFFGGGAVFWAKKPAKREYINDYNGMVVNFYEQIKSNFQKLKKIIDATPFSRDLYRNALIIYENPHIFKPVRKAWAFWVATNCGFNNQIGNLSTSEKRPNSVANKRKEFNKELSDRLDKVFIENIDAIEIIRRVDDKNAFFYIDPPYVGANQGHYGGYTQEHFNQLLECLSKIKGKFMLSSYPNDQLSQYIKDFDWKTDDKELNLTAGGSSEKKKTECLTMNYNIHQNTLFVIY